MGTGPSRGLSEARPAGEQPVFRGRQGARDFYEIVFGGFEELRAEVAAIRAIGTVAVALLEEGGGA